jgi:phage portal protein BeeE
MASGEETFVVLPDEIAHFAPTKDPLAKNRGISLLTAGLREVLADNAATSHKLAFFENAATPNLALKFPADDDQGQGARVDRALRAGARAARRTRSRRSTSAPASSRRRSG